MSVLTSYRYFLDAHRVVVKCKPSASMRERLEKEENERIEKQVASLGEDGLRRAAEALEAAKAENDVSCPPEVLTSFPIPDISTISWIPVSSVQNRSTSEVVAAPNGADLQRHLAADSSKVPVFVEFDSVKVRISSGSTCHSRL